MKIITNHPVAHESPDHIFPWGTARDNTTSIKFIEEIEKYFDNKKIKTLDVGCSGGQLTIDFNNRGHIGIGIEGSDYSLKNKRANWTEEYYNKFLFTCDATKHYKIVDDDNNIILFDLITAWEVLEHINKKDFDSFFQNIKNHMNENSIFCASINTAHDEYNGIVLHQSVHSKEIWINEILSKYFYVFEYPFNDKVRYQLESFNVLLKNKIV